MNHDNLRTFIDQRWLSKYRGYLPAARKLMQQPTRTAFGVDNTTIRAVSTGLRGREHGPLAVFNEWASLQWKQLLRERHRWNTFNTEPGFERLHRRCVKKLCSHWKRRMDTILVMPAVRTTTRSRPVAQTLCLAHANKLVDLYVR